MNPTSETVAFAQCLFQQSNDGILVFDIADLTVTEANPRAITLTATPHEQLLGLRLTDLIVASGRKDLERFILQCQPTGETSPACEYHFARPSGRSLPLQVKFSHFESESGTQGLMFLSDVVTTDPIENAARYQSLVEHAPVCIHGIDSEGRMSFINPAGRRMLSIEDDGDVVGKAYLSFIAESERSHVADLMRRAFTGESSNFEFPCEVNGRPRVFSSGFIPVFDRSGAVSMLMGATQDVTEERRALVELSESQRALKNAQARAEMGSWEFYPDTERADWSDEMYRLYYLDPSEAAPTTVEDFVELIHPDDREAVLLRHKRLWGTDLKVENLDVRTNPDRGRVRWLDSSVARVPDSRMPTGFFVAGTVIDVTDRKVVEMALRDSEHRFRTLCQHSAMGIFLADTDGQCTYFNESGCNIIGLTKEAAIGDGWAGAIHPDDRDEILRQWQQALQTDGFFDVECRFRHADGQDVWARVRSVVRQNDQGDPVGYVGSFVDVTTRKTAQRRLEQSEQRFRNLVENAPEAIVLLDPESGKFVDYNQNALQLFRCDAETLCQAGPADFCPPTQADGQTSVESAAAYIREAIDGGLPVFEWIHRDHFGTDIPCEIRLLGLHIDSKILVRGSITDITYRKKAEQQLRMTRFAIESTNDAMFVIDQLGHFVDVNSVACSRLGYTREELLKMSILEVNPTYSEQSWAPHWRQIKQRGRVSFESTHQRKDGSTFPVEIAKSFFEFEGKEYAFTFVRDISERKQVQKKLQMTQFAIDRNQGPIVIVDSRGRVTYANDSMCDHLGYSRDEILAMHVWDVDPGWPRESWRAGWLTLRRKLSECLETTHLRKDGSVRQVEVTSNYFRLGDEEFVFAFTVDVTEKRQTEERLKERERQLAHVTRLSTMGEMVAGIAHELNQPLYSIVNYSHATRNVLKDPTAKNLAQIDDWNKQVGDAAARAGQIIKQLRGFVQRDTTRSATPLHEAIGDALELLRYQFDRAKITLMADLPPSGPVVFVDRVQIQQVLVNLLLNAIEAIEQSDRGAREITISASAQKDFVDVTVSDTGCGLLATDDRKIFAAFETTKAGGMGMGLAISNSIIESSGGQLLATNNERGGADFRFTLPLAGGSENDAN